MKSFLEVFPDLHIADNVRELFELVEVEKVATTRDRSSIRIYIVSPRLIHKQNIYKLEEGIKSQLFPGKKVTIKILEKYHLSGQYTPKKLMDVYRDSILMELKNYSILLYNMFRRAVLSFDEKDLLTMEIEDTMIAKDKAPELVRILEKIFTERCNIPMEVRLSYRPAEARKRVEEEPAVIYMNAEHTSGGAAPSDPAPVSGEASLDLPFDEGSSVLKPVGDLNFQAEKKQKAVKETGGKNAQSKAGGDLSGKKGKGDFSGGKREFRRSGYGRKSDNPDVLYGRDFDEESVEIEKIEGEIGEVVIRGKILATDVRELRSGNSLFIFSISDFTDTISVKVFAREESLEDLKTATKAGQFVRLKGVANIDRFDGELTIGSVVGIKKCEDFTTKRVDNAPVKRVELHCHTKMSDMDGVSEVKDLIKRAKQWGMDAMAVTDHGCVQSFPDANHSVERGDNFKVLYGVEGYLVDDMKELVENGAGQSLDHTCVVFDIETTGFSPLKNRIIEIGAVRVEEGRIVDKFSSFVNPDVPIPFEIEKLTGINDNMVLDAPKIDRVLPEFLEFCRGAVMVAHNAGFDISFIKENARQQGLEFNPTVLDTVSLARVLLPNLNRFKLDTVAKELKINLANHHRAVDDAGATAEIFVRFIKMLKERDIFDLSQLNELSRMTVEMIRKMPTYHIIIIAKNDVGRVNLYRLVSESNLTYFARRPRIPKSLLSQYREGLIIGSACEAGELYQALLRGVPDTEIHKIVDFYDYLEIQPLGNNAFMLRDEKSPVNSEEELMDLNRRIVGLGEQYNKPVCATCDVHFLDPEDEVYRRIIMSSKGFKDADDQAPLYLRTTDEMLREFEYLGSDKAEEVITNTRKIAAMCERIEPVRPDKCAPVIPNSDETLRSICYNKAHEMYGENLPKIVVDRLERELNSIISNGFAVMYIIAQKLVWKSNEDGYLVGSRGSVGSSLVATMSGITEVNPLSPHYYCTNCHYYDFDSEEVRKFAGMAGCDMPDKNCPVCGEPLKKDGFDIPFETFLGFKGDKEPDIDLNFSGEYQSRAHTYTEVIFGKGQTFRAGTIGTLADKTAYGYVKGYYEDRGVRKRRCEIDRIVGGCVGVRRTTGQHPGGIIVLPHGEEIYSFTPVQHPADDMTTRTVTTHFDYHSIDHNLLKLDILGHDDPTMIRMLQDLTGQDPVKDFPLDSKEVMSLFQNTSALGIEPEDIGGCKLGALGIPEFGTDFAMQMLIDAQPKYFSDLVRISGLSHGTDVWLGNAGGKSNNSDGHLYPRRYHGISDRHGPGRGPGVHYHGERA